MASMEKAASAIMAAIMPTNSVKGGKAREVALGAKAELLGDLKFKPNGFAEVFEGGLDFEVVGKVVVGEIVIFEMELGDAKVEEGVGMKRSSRKIGSDDVLLVEELGPIFVLVGFQGGAIMVLDGGGSDLIGRDQLAFLENISGGEGIEKSQN